MGKLRTTPKLEAKAIKDYLATKSVHKAAKRCGLGSTTVHRILKRNGIKATGLDELRKRIRKLPESAELKAEYEAGAHMSEIAKKYGTCHQTVHEALHKAGADMRRRGGQRRYFTEEEKEQIISVYGKVGSQAAVAWEFNTHQSQISNILRKAGITRESALGKAHGMWKGGVIKTSGGYVQEKLRPDDDLYEMATASGYVMQHRLVMARRLGRKLNEGESVHHINGDKKDNRIENLQLRQLQHGKGVRHVCRDCGSTNVKTVKI